MTNDADDTDQKGGYCAQSTSQNWPTASIHHVKKKLQAVPDISMLCLLGPTTEKASLCGPEAVQRLAFSYT